MENTESNNLNENCKELWIFQYDTEINLDQKYFEKLTELESGEFNFETLSTLFFQD